MNLLKPVNKYLKAHISSATIHTQSHIRLILFILFTLISTQNNLMANDSADASESNQNNASTINTFNVGVHLTATYHVPILDEELWQNYITGGLNIDVSTKIPNVMARIYFSAGQLDMEEENADLSKSICDALAISSQKFSRVSLGIFSKILLSCSSENNTSSVIESYNPPSACKSIET